MKFFLSQYIVTRIVAGYKSRSSLWSMVLFYLWYPVSLSHEKVNQLMCQHLVSSLTNLKYEQYTHTGLSLIVDLLLIPGVGKLLTFTSLYGACVSQTPGPKGIFVDTKYKSNVKRCLLHFSSKVLDIKVADNSFEHFSNSYTWTVQCNSIYYMIIQFWCHTNAQPLVNLQWQSLWHKTLSEQQNNLSKTT